MSSKQISIIVVTLFLITRIPINLAMNTNSLFYALAFSLGSFVPILIISLLIYAFRRKNFCNILTGTTIIIGIIATYGAFIEISSK